MKPKSACSAVACAPELISASLTLIFSVNMACGLFTLAGLPRVELGLFFVLCVRLAGGWTAAGLVNRVLGADVVSASGVG